MKTAKIALVLGLIGLSTTALVTKANAFGPREGMSPLIEEIVTKYNLNRTEVEDLVSKHKASKLEHREQKHATKLQRALEAGVINAEQKAQIEAKWQELASQRMQKRDQMKAFLSSIGVDPEKFHQIQKGN